MRDNKIEFNLDFGGFYDSIANDIIDNAICFEYICINDVDDIYSVDDIYNKDEKFMNNIDYYPLKNEYAKLWLEKFNRYFNTYFIYKGIWSPKYYNFETDKIKCEISESYINDIINYKDSNLVDFINEVSQSYDGFHSFYEGWNKVITNKAVFMNYYTRWLLDSDPHFIDQTNESLYEDYELPKNSIEGVNYEQRR